MTLNPFDPEGRFYWGLGALAVGALFACVGLFFGLNALLFSTRAEAVEVTVVALAEREGQNAQRLAPVFEVRRGEEVIRDISSTARLHPTHSVGDREAGYLQISNGRIETATTLRDARRFGTTMGALGLGIGLFGLFLLRRRPAP
ncbi:MAG: hypothetical protein AAFP13_06295 [Pseudomonadota bacterium]